MLYFLWLVCYSGLKHESSKTEQRRILSRIQTDKTTGHVDSGHLATCAFCTLPGGQFKARFVLFGGYLASKPSPGVVSEIPGRPNQRAKGDIIDIRIYIYIYDGILHTTYTYMDKNNNTYIYICVHIYIYLHIRIHVCLPCPNAAPSASLSQEAAEIVLEHTAVLQPELRRQADSDPFESVSWGGGGRGGGGTPKRPLRPY